MSKSEQLRALREGKTAQVGALRASKAPAGPRQRKTAKLNPEPNGGEMAVSPPQPTELSPGPGQCCPTCGRFWAKGTGKFDRKAYQREYMRKRRLTPPV